MIAVKKIAAPTVPSNDHDDYEDYEEITVERLVKVPAAAADASTRKTARLSKIDSRLLAIARGELDPDDPFGGLIPIYDIDTDEEALEVDDAWLVVQPDPVTTERLFGDAVPAVRLRPRELESLPIEPRSTLFLSQVDGKRTVTELVRLCRLEELTGLEIVDELLRLGAIELR